ncbi:MAG: carbohydrate-binding protein [Planctomycetota bacterium]|nr:carbohydrate-binding protein [Planctomycetota bacterium]
MRTLAIVLAVSVTSAAFAVEHHVSVQGPLKTISAAAQLAQPGDVITVHEGVYRECVAPPRGGESDAKRITYQAAPGEQVVITGSEIVQGWERVGGDTWKLTLPNKFFGDFNPYADRIHGDWFDPQGRQHHTGAVYLNGEWLTEAASHLNEVLKPAGKRPLWFARVDNAEDADYLLNLAAFTMGQQRVTAASLAAKHGELHEANCSEGGKCIGWIRSGSWLRFDKVNFGAGTESIDFRAASVTGGGDIEVRLDKPDGELLGTCVVADTGDWLKWATFTAKLKPTTGEKTVFLVFRSHKSGTDNTTIWAQFPGVNPNAANVEINVRKTVFTPDKPGINYITVRGFTLRNAATNWAPPTAGQIGLVSAYWCKGWIIENNDIGYSRCSGVALGKYSDDWDNRAESAEGYVGTLTRALAYGWNKATVGGHVVRDNHIHHCEQTGIVGSLGCSFSTVTGNEIHEIHVQGLFGGAEMAGIKFHGAIDVVISNNHIYRCGEIGGIWLDWMAQGALVTGNLLHDNWNRDIFCEMQHGPLLIANNLLLSRTNSFLVNAKGLAIAHNLIVRPFEIIPYDGRKTPFHKAHSTEVVGLADAPGGDHRFYNNLFIAPCNVPEFDKAKLPCFGGGNVFTKGAQPAKFETGALVKPDFDAGMKLEQKPDGWYLTITADAAWKKDQPRQLVTTELLGKMKIPNLPCENPDGTPLKLDTDYFGHPRDTGNPFPGPLETTQVGPQILKVWPKP